MKTTDRTVHALRPAALDDLADDGHARRRDDDLARIMRAAPEPAARRPRSRRPVLLVAGATAAACAVTGVVVTSGGDRPAPPAAGQPAAEPLDARTFLLASAEAVEQAPAEAGRYWYIKQVTSSLTDHRVGVFDKGERKRREKLPYTFRYTRGQETWLARNRDDRSRTVVGLDVRAEFPTPEDKAAWKDAGSPPLIAPAQKKKSVNNYDVPLSYKIGDISLATDEVRELPTDAAALETELRESYKADANRYPDEERTMPPFSSYVFWTAVDLLAGPITPGTKAALYRVLAEQPDVRSEGLMKDPLGRTGVALSIHVDPVYDSDGPATDVRLIIAKDSAELLAYESVGQQWTAYKDMGWVDELGARP